MKRICTIVARAGSKGVPGKNLRLLLGRPLIAHSVDQARASGLFDTIAVSSDGADIRAAGTASGASIAVVRPADLSSDEAGKVPAIVHCVEACEQQLGTRFDTVVDLDVTSPLRTVEDIVAAVAMLEDSGAPNLITAAPARRSPYFNLIERAADGSVQLSKPSAVNRRQDSPECFDMNASIYVWRRDALTTLPGLFAAGTLLYEMPEERSHDIDSEVDFAIVELLMRRAAEGKA